MTFSLPRTLSSIGVKLFLSFWLITISSIAITRFVSAQLEQESTIIETHQGDLRKLAHLKKRISRRQPKSIQQILEHEPFPKGMSILIKNEQNQEVYFHEKRYLKNISLYLQKNDIAHQTSIQFPFIRITGPEIINVNNQPYQFYAAIRVKSPHLGSVFMQLPTWARFVIPLFVSFILCWILAKTLTKPILALKSAALEFGNGNYDIRVTDATKRNDELGAMANSFNQMADKLKANIHAHQRLLADVSHELRSPMTRLQIALGLVTKSLDNKAQVEKHVERCEREIAQLDNMINHVLSLSRLENSCQDLQLSELNVDKLLIQATEDAQLLANEKAITIELAFSFKDKILLDQNLFLSAINNILINAIKYSHQQSSISVNCHKHDSLESKSVIISVTDSGIGVPEQQLSLLFKPFYRVSDARDRDSGGTGLGLAIAKQAIEMHNGKISAQNNHSGGLTITIELPLN